MKKIIIIMSFFTSLFGAAQETDNIKVLTKEDFKIAIEKENVQLVDVRTSKEYNAGFIKNAINIDYFDESNFSEKFNELDKEEPVYIYCRSGNRSQKAAKKLENLGFKEIYDLKGGYLNW